MNALEKYHKLYQENLVHGNDEKIRSMFGEHMSELVEIIYSKIPQVIDDFVDDLESGIESTKWHNYLTEKEAKMILSKLNPAAKWTISDVENTCDNLGVPYENKPHWNLPALAVAMNAINSDFKSLRGLFDDETKYVSQVYKMAVEMLEDIDNPRYIRKRYLS